MSEPALVGTYRREVGASLARVWENVLDWEHLPWLHSSSFTDVRLLDAGRDHWRGWVTTAHDSKESMIDTRLDRPKLRYVVRTLEGSGRGSEILTMLDPRGEHRTGIAVEFRIPDVPPELGERIGNAYVALYERLWDEDETMMTERQRVLDGERERRTASSEPLRDLRPRALGTEAEVRARLPLVVEALGRRFRIVDVGGELHAHPTTCPHLGGPLGDGTVEDGVVTCPWHGYRFDVATGRSADGRSCGFAPSPRVSVEPRGGTVRLVWCDRHKERP